MTEACSDSDFSHFSVEGLMDDSKLREAGMFVEVLQDDVVRLYSPVLRYTSELLFTAPPQLDSEVFDRGDLA